MSLEELKENLKKNIEQIIVRNRFDTIICTSSMIIENGWRENEIENFFRENKFNKIVVNAMMFVNAEFRNGDLAGVDNEIELEEIYDYTNKRLDDINRDCNELITQGENFYELNELFKKLIIAIDSEIKTLDKKTWVDNNCDGLKPSPFFVTIGGIEDKRDKLNLHKIKFDVDNGLCNRLFANAFYLRTVNLQRVKYELVNFYSKYLVIPENRTLPKLKFTEKKVAIVELLMAIRPSFENNDFELFKSIMLNMFDITAVQFKNSSHEISNKKNANLLFTTKLNDQIKSYIKRNEVKKDIDAKKERESKKEIK